MTIEQFNSKSRELGYKEIRDIDAFEEINGAYKSLCKITLSDIVFIYNEDKKFYKELVNLWNLHIRENILRGKAIMYYGDLKQRIKK